MAKYFIMMVALIVAFDSLVAPKLLANAGQMKCADVLKNPNEVHRELSSRNLNGNKIIKFIENCIKSVDGWRFKKSGSGHVSIGSNTVPGTSAIQSAPSTNMAFEYFPAMLHDSSSLGSLPTSASVSASTSYSPSSSSSSSSPLSSLSSRLSELANLEKHFRHFYGPMFYAKMSNLLAEQQAQQAQQAQQRQLEAEQLEQEHPTLNSNSNTQF